MMRIDLDNGKYTVWADENMGNFKATRYGEDWRDLTGDNLVYFMALRIEELETTLKKVQEGLAEIEKTMDFM